MEGTVVLTGANGSLALGFVQALLETHPQKTLVATVRNPSPEQDPNTEKLLALAARFPKAKFHLETLDLGKLANVRSFADKLSRLISSGRNERRHTTCTFASPTVLRFPFSERNVLGPHGRS